jgi:hypothetical protein
MAIPVLILRFQYIYAANSSVETVDSDGHVSSSSCITLFTLSTHYEEQKLIVAVFQPLST